jgi:hypothetical protein
VQTKVLHRDHEDKSNAAIPEEDEGDVGNGDYFNGVTLPMLVLKATSSTLLDKR